MHWRIEKQGSLSFSKKITMRSRLRQGEGPLGIFACYINREGSSDLWGDALQSAALIHKAFGAGA